jgi:hypothetical protein
MSSTNGLHVDLPAAQFRDVMKNDAHIKNIKNFHEYVYRILSGALEKPPRGDELHPRVDERQPSIAHSISHSLAKSF